MLQLGFSYFKIPVFSLLALLLTHSAHADEFADSLINQIISRHQGYGSLFANIEMIISEKNGFSQTARLRYRSVERPESEKRAIIIDYPPDIAGTRILYQLGKNGDIDQWLLLPETRRVRHVSTAHASRSFLGSGFSLNELDLLYGQNYNYQLIGTDHIQNMNCYRIMRTSTDSGESQIIWIDKQHGRVLRIDFFSRDDRKTKQAEFIGHRQYLKKYWRPSQMILKNLQSNTVTTMKWSEILFKHAKAPGDINTGNLARLR